MKMTLQNFGEAFVIDLDNVMFFEADDHYTHVVMADGYKFLVPFGLGRIEEELKSVPADNHTLIRLGRRYIVNNSRIFHINILKQIILLYDNKGSVRSLQISRAVLRSLLDNL